MAKFYSTEIEQQIREYLNENNWHYKFDDEFGEFQFSVKLLNKLKSADYRIDVSEDYFAVCVTYSIGPDGKDADMMARMAEFICRVNWRCRQGHFNLDFRDGEIRFEDYVCCEGTRLSKEMVDGCILNTLFVSETYGNSIARLIFGKAVPEREIRRSDEYARQLFDKPLDESETGSDETGSVEAESGSGSDESESPSEEYLEEAEALFKQLFETIDEKYGDPVPQVDNGDVDEIRTNLFEDEEDE